MTDLISAFFQPTLNMPKDASLASGVAQAVVNTGLRHKLPVCSGLAHNILFP